MPTALAAECECVRCPLHLQLSVSSDLWEGKDHNAEQRGRVILQMQHSPVPVCCRYFLVDFYAPTSAVENILEHLARDIDVVRPNIVKHPLTQEVKECDGIVPVPLEEKLYSTKRRKK